MGSRFDNDIRAIERGYGLAQPPCRQDSILGNRLRPVEKHNVHVACELRMLKSIVQQKNVRALLFKPLSLRVPVFSDSEQASPAQTMFHQLDFVAGPAFAPVSPA